MSLQGTEFSTELAVCEWHPRPVICATLTNAPVADGYQLKLTDPYNRPTLYVRRPGSDVEEVHKFHDDDPFLSEMATFIDLAGKGTSDIPVLSSYADAVKTYEATWAIRWASEKTRRRRE